MNIKILMDNNAACQGCASAHGLSVYVETAHHKVLVDAGPDASFAKNAAAMNVDLKAVDTVVLSHGHYDHSGGLSEFMRINSKAVIYAAEGFEKPHYDRDGRYIGVEPALIGNPRIKTVSGNHKIDEELGILQFNHGALLEEIDECGMSEGTILEDGTVRLAPESFDHEQFLLVNEGEKKVLFSGCSHKGIVNIAGKAAKFHVAAIFGGFHFMGVKPEEFARLENTAKKLLEYPVTYYTGHCTGMEQYEFMKGIMGDSLHYAASGSEFTI